MDAGNFYSESIEAVKQLNRRAVLLIGKIRLQRIFQKILLP